jgi:hypothetical protein
MVVSIEYWIRYQKLEPFYATTAVGPLYLIYVISTSSVFSENFIAYSPEYYS